MIHLFGTLIAKELITFLRSWGLVVMVLYSFTLDIYIAGSGIEVEAKNISIGYVDQTDGILSQKIMRGLHKPEFKRAIRFLSTQALYNAIRNRKIMVGLIFESDFSKKFYQKRITHINLLLDSISASQSFQALSYLQNIIFELSNSSLPIQLKIHKLFNPNTQTSWFMSLAELLSIITLLGVILTASVFVKEKENGTWEIMLLTPIDPRIIILTKSLSQVLILMGGILLATGLILFNVFNIPMNGSFFDFFLLSFFYAFTSAGIGLFIASISKTMLQVAQLAILIMMPMIFLSGAWTPVYAMHPIFQKLSLLSPLRYYIEGSESIFFRGSSFIDLLPYVIGVVILGSILYLYGFRKIGKLF